MSLVPLEIPENFRAYAKERDANVRVEHHLGDEINGEWYPESWHITLSREKKLKDGRFWVRSIGMPDDVEQREPIWGVQLNLLDMAWEADMEKVAA